MKLILASLALGSTLIGTSYAAPVVELPAGSSEDACLKKAADLVSRYLEIVDLDEGFGIKAVRFGDLINTSPGSYNQTYEARVDLIHKNEIDFGVNRARYTFEFSSPFICDNLKILSVKDLGIDKQEPLYACLHSEEVAALEAQEEVAFDAHLEAASKACDKVVGIKPKLKCEEAFNASEGKALFDALEAARDNTSAYNKACYSKFPL
jgi:hypothetical protein